MSNWKQYLSSLYFDPNCPVSFAGVEKVYQYIKSQGKYKIGRPRIRKWLQSQQSYSLTRGARRRFPRSRVIVRGIDSQWDMDLMDMVDLAEQNEGYKYVLVSIDIFSRFAFCQPIKSKKGTEIVNALERILSGPRKPNTVRTDRGMESRSKEVNKYLQHEGIHHFYALNTETKANYSEILIKNLKRRLFRYMLKKRTQRYINILEKILRGYNRTIHRSLGKRPIDITTENEGESRLQQYLLRTKMGKTKLIKRKSYKFKIGQTVRASHVKSVFDREYSQKWTGEIFKIKTRFKREGVPVYTIADWDNNDQVDGTFYEQELQAVNVDETTEYHVEKILKKRVRNKQRQVLVRWLHWPAKYDSWIPEQDVTQYS
ncbi:uncharacterized protein LOC128554280 [Mercenaria mercenaria]|uniref:uncharacterized protein LOC128554280 n=1 Tax=Mercenaria mercenaria TaxID=6596 RepID=UPI00234E9B22|nr:uncharacterized protein LOC128554280 [Mercenaria mercenaria]